MKRASTLAKVVSAGLLSLVGCSREPASVHLPEAKRQVTTPKAPSLPAPASSDWPRLPASGALPDYLVRLEASGNLYGRVDGGLVPISTADLDVLRGYGRWVDKGPLDPSTSERLTILTAKRVYASGEDVSVLHVHEATKAGVELYVMGPKAIYGEYVDGKLVSPAALAPPSSYDGAVVPGPGVDSNYQITVHRLPAGAHTIEWRFSTLSGPRVLRSNVLSIEVR